MSGYYPADYPCDAMGMPLARPREAPVSRMQAAPGQQVSERVFVVPQGDSDGFLMNLCLVLTAAVILIAFLAGLAVAQLMSLRSMVEANHRAIFADVTALPRRRLE